MTGYSRRRLLVTTGAAAVPGIAGCSLLQGNPPLDKLEIGLVDIRLPSVGVTSATIPLVLEFYNPASAAIPDISGDFDIFINETRVGSEELTVNRVEPDERTTETIETIIEYMNVGDAVIEAVRNQSFQVRLSGELNAGGATRTATVSGSL